MKPRSCFQGGTGKLHLPSVATEPAQLLLYPVVGISKHLLLLISFRCSWSYIRLKAFDQPAWKSGRIDLYQAPCMSELMPMHNVVMKSLDSSDMGTSFCALHCLNALVQVYFGLDAPAACFPVEVRYQACVSKQFQSSLRTELNLRQLRSLRRCAATHVACEVRVECRS